MRVCFRKIHCPSSICFSSCKPPEQLCTPPPATYDFTAKEKQEQVVVVDGTELVLKSSIKRKVVVNAQSEEESTRKKTVQWMDVAGKDLVQVKEFETSESEDTDSESEHNRGCICAII